MTVKRGKRFVALCVMTVASLMSNASVANDNNPMTSAEIDALVEQVMEKYSVPGMTVGVIKDGEVLHAKGYGIRELGKKGKVDEKTLFAIASNSKAFTSTALAILVDEGKLGWEDKVIDHIPDFRLHDPWVTREFTVRDLLIHNSGLGLGAGDLMFWPSAEREAKEVIHNLRYLKPVSSFRSEYAYDNLLYIVAGEVIASVSGMSFGEFVNKRIMKPLGMKRCAADRSILKREKNYARPHGVIEGELIKFRETEAIHETPLYIAAGGIQCSIRSMMKWVGMHLKRGEFGDGERLISKKQHDNLWKPWTIMTPDDVDRNWSKAHFRNYGLAFRMIDSHGYKVISHGGWLMGLISHTRMVPELGLGVVVMLNQQAAPARDAVYMSIINSYLTDERPDWVQRYADRDAKRRARAQKTVEEQQSATAANKMPSLPISAYVGTYTDNWFGNVTIEEREGGLYFTAEKSSPLKGKVNHFNGNVFTVIWDDRSLEADAYISFETDFAGTVSGATMKAISPITDFSFDFHDLDFVKSE